MIDQKGIVKAYVRYLKLQRNMSGNTLDAYQRDLRNISRPVCMISAFILVRNVAF